MITTKRVEIAKLFEVFDEKALRKYAYEYTPENVSDFEAEARQDGSKRREAAGPRGGLHTDHC
jgi:hypothetical protein